ncbi:hypothetical protein TELCIR_01576 [Teladorsagia circumcincta]|uniref:MD-2-related lipid-recognition domain-containing protein n=1 Tax=Teladorsagia circumcincta TaxID=45464 RepID=A0A2G9V1J2_TELCI|nr:hypothetical protein TELCIR_01576 [Teladorsagia circumcincta]
MQALVLLLALVGTGLACSKNFEYPIHLGRPIMMKCDVLNPTHVYKSPNLMLTISLWSSNLDACTHGVPCPIELGRQELDVMVDFTKFQAIINMLKDDSPYQLEYAMHDKASKDNICFMAQARAKLD